MNPLGNITFYDGLCKLCVGILLIGWIPFTVRCLGFDSIHDLQQTILIALFVIISFVVGNLWHHLFIEKVFFLLINNQISIRNAYKTIYCENVNCKSFDVHNHSNDYYIAYYRLENLKMLDTVHVLEALEAFIRDTILIFIMYAIVLLVLINCQWQSYISCSMRCIFSIASIVIPLLWIWLRHIIQFKIYELVWEADFYCNHSNT